MQGIFVKSPHGTVTSKARLLMCTADLPARAQILNMKQYNGKQGYAYCEDEGTPRHQAISSGIGCIQVIIYSVLMRK